MAGRDGRPGARRAVARGPAGVPVCCHRLDSPVTSGPGPALDGARSPTNCRSPPAESRPSRPPFGLPGGFFAGPGGRGAANTYDSHRAPAGIGAPFAFGRRRHAPRRTRRRGWRRTWPLPLPGAGGGACPAASTASALLRGSPTSTCGGRRQAAAAGARGLPPAGPALGATAQDSPCESGALGRPSAPCDGRTPSRRRRGLSVSAAARQAPPAGCRGLSSASRGLQVRSRPPTSRENSRELPGGRTKRLRPAPWRRAW